MNRMLKKLSGPIDNALERVERRFRKARPGSVMIMVVALLVLLALMGTAYLATARQDRIAAGRIRDNGIEFAVKQAAVDALATAGTWLANDTQTFTTQTISDPEAITKAATGAGLGVPIYSNTLVGPLVASRVPDLAPLGPPFIPGSNGPFDFPPVLKDSSNHYAVRWKRLTTPPNYSRFVSPITTLDPGTNVNNYSLDSYHYYDLNDAEDWAAPTAITITYPLDYAGTESLRGQTRTFPAIEKFTFKQTPGTATGTTLRSGPFAAGDASGGGIADCALVQLDIPTVEGVTFFAGFRIVDNAAAINLNTAWGPNPYNGSTPAGTVPNWDAAKNAFNFFPSDIDLYGFLNTAFNTENDPTQNLSEMPMLQSRRVYYASGGNEPYWSTAQSDGGVAHPDVNYLYRGEAMWWHLGRRLDNPLFKVAGDYLDGGRRPFDDVDTVALGFHGVMTDAASPQSKIEQVFKNVNPNANLSDSVYRGAMNYMVNSQDRFTLLPANAVAYWYDWNFNFEGYTGAGLLTPPMSPTLGIGLGGATDSFAIGGGLGNGGLSGPPPYTTVNSAFQAAFRTPRSLFVGRNPVLNMARYVDPVNWPDVTQKINAGGAVAGLPTPPVAMATLGVGDLQRKISLNTGTFEELWRAFGNVFNDFSSETGTGPTNATGSINGTYPLHLMRDLFGYDLRDPNGPNPKALEGVPVDPTKPFINPRQFRTPMRDPLYNESTSNGNTAFATPPSGGFRAWLDSRNTAALRAALAAVNVLTLRDQHGQMYADSLNPGAQYFDPYVTKRAIQLNVHTGLNASSPVTAYVYGTSAQPYITEVYASTDTSTHKDSAGNPLSNPNGLVILKLYNPYPYPISLRGYDIAVIDRSGFGTGIGNTTSTMTATLVSRTTGTAGGLFGTTSIPANGYLLVTNYGAATTGYWPAYLKAGAKGWPAVPDPTKTVIVEGLTDVLGGTTKAGTGTTQNPANGAELVLLRPLSPDGTTANANPNLTTTNFVQPEAPVDSFDFTGLTIASTTTYYNWHYLRASGNNNDTDAVSGAKPKPWTFVHPGPYSGTGTFANPMPKKPAGTYAGKMPHFVDVDVAEWTPGTGVEKDPWDQDDVADPSPRSTKTNNAAPTWHYDLTVAAVSSTSTYVPTTPFPGIQLCNIDFGGFNKRNPAAATPVAFPYGGFARVGDVQQVPFIGSYVIFPNNSAAPAWPPALPGGAGTTAVTVAEVNPVTMDSCFADDGDPADDAYEQVGRFVPLLDPAGAAGGIDDFSPTGLYPLNPTVLDYTPADPKVLNRLPDAGPTPDIVSGPGAVQFARWRYHFATEVFNQFTTIASPGEDYFPNLHPDSWYVATPTPTSGPPPAGTPIPVVNTGWAGVEGLVNVNTADWRTLAAVEMIPRSLDATGLLNTRLAKAIVHYRDVDDGFTHQSLTWDPTTGTWIPTVGSNIFRRGHGPFNSLAELNNVYDLSVPATGNSFQNGMGTLGTGIMNSSTLASSAQRRARGYYIPGGPGPAAPTTSADAMLQTDDWLGQNLMINRVSNLLTTRSDSFTVYVVVQGWKNAFAATDGSNPKGPWPELVIQKRMAMTVDRSTITPTSRTLKTTLFPTK